jgi:hypothetical protein
MVARLAKALRTSSKELKKIKDAADKAKKSRAKPTTQKGLKLSKNKDIRMPEREIETPVVVGRTGITKTGEKINVGTPEDITRTVGGKKHAERKETIRKKEKEGTATKKESAELKARERADALAKSKQERGVRPPKKVPDGEYFNTQTGQLVTNPKLQNVLTKGGKENNINNWVKDPTPNQIEKAKVNKITREKSDFRKGAEAKLAEPKSAPKSTGSAVENKRRIGTNDYRKGGYVLSTVDNRKNKRK